MSNRFGLRLTVWFFAAALGAAAVSGQIPVQQVQVDRSRLERIEDLSESFANDMLELSVSVRNRDLRRVADFFADSLEAQAFPSQPGELKTEVKWIRSHRWSMTESTVPGRPAISREEFLAGWGGFLEHFSEVEDARFKVKQADFESPEVARTNARLAFYVVGRDDSGRREWARGVALVTAVREENGPWRIRSFKLLSLDSMVAAEEIFSEVSIPAGVDVALPPYGSPSNNGFVWHGAAAGDLNNDGLIDLFVTGSKGNYLYLNEGNGKFRDVSLVSGVKTLLVPATQPLILDYDNDGDSDLFISAVGPQVLLRNRLIPDGKMAFEDVSVEAGVDAGAVGFSAAAGDVNGDGFPDIYVASYNRYGFVTPDSWYRATNGTPNLLFINQKNGTFREEGTRWGVADRRWSYAAAFADVNGDGRLDLYVANDFGEKALYINKGDRFVDEARERGVLDPGNGMGVAFGDFNNDGLLDIHATNMSSTAGNRILSRLFPQSNVRENVLLKLASGNNLFENMGEGRFRDVTSEVGGFGGGWAWGGGFIDFDNDGWEDIYTPNGFISGKSMKDT